MEPTKFTRLINDYILGTISTDDKQIIDNILLESEGLQVEFAEHKRLIEALRQHQDVLDLQQSLEKQHGNQEGITTTTKRSIFKRRRVSKKQKFVSTFGIGLAVSIIMGLTITYILLNNKHKQKLLENQAITEANERIDLLNTRIEKLEAKLTLKDLVPSSLALFSASHPNECITVNSELNVGEKITLINSDDEREFEVLELYYEGDLCYVNKEVRSSDDSLRSTFRLFLGDTVRIQTILNGEVVQFQCLISSVRNSKGQNYYCHVPFSLSSGSLVWQQDRVVGLTKYVNNFTAEILIIEENSSLNDLAVFEIGLD